MSLFEGNEKEKRQRRCRDNDSNRNAGKRWKVSAEIVKKVTEETLISENCDEAALVYTDKWKDAILQWFRYIGILISITNTIQIGKVSSIVCILELAKRTVNRISKDI